jgi:hypothetical protein
MYKCYDDIESEFVLDKSTFNENYLFSNIEFINNKITKLFQTKYFYTKDEIIKSLSEYPLIQIYASLSYLIDYKDKFEDKYGQLGYLINIGDYYLYQPANISDENINLYDRTTPLFYKPDKVELTIDTLQINNENISVIYNNCRDIYVNTLNGIGIDENDLYSYYQNSIVEFIKIFKVDDIICRSFIVEHIFDCLLFNDKLALIQHIFGKDTRNNDEFGSLLHDYLDKLIVIFNTSFEKKKQKGFYFVDLNKKNDFFGKIILFDGTNWVENTTYIKTIESIVENKMPMNQYIGFIGFDSDFKNYVFKIKDIEMQRNIGSRCDQTNKRKYVSMLNDFIGRQYFNRKNVEFITIKQIAVLIEMTCRYFNTIKPNKWFLTTEQAYLAGFFQKKIIKKDD